MRTLDHSWIEKFYRRIETNVLMNVFAVMSVSMKRAAMVREGTLVESSKIESKLNVWKYLDRKIADK